MAGRKNAIRGERDIYQEVTDRVLQALGRGVAPWRQPWVSLQAQNAVSHRPYRGVNLLLLSLSPHHDHRWLTFKQARDLGGTVKRGEHGSLVILWHWVEKETEEKKSERIPLLRSYTLFNVEQCEGLKLAPLADLLPTAAASPIEAAQQIIDNMPQSPHIEHGGQVAAYSPRLDRVIMPDAAAFEKLEAYYSTCYHELIHSTGHESRLNRQGVTEGARFGSEVYSKEELLCIGRQHERLDLPDPDASSRTPRVELPDRPVVSCPGIVILDLRREEVDEPQCRLGACVGDQLRQVHALRQY